MAEKITLVDKKMKCEVCEGDYIFTKGEQAFYLQKAFAEPKRCTDCRKGRKKERRKNRRKLMRSLRASEDVKVEVEVAQASPTVDQKPTSEVKTQEEAKMGIEEAKPIKKEKKKKVEATKAPSNILTE